MQTQTIEDIDRYIDEIRAAARTVYQENRELRALLASFAGPARLVLEEVDRFAEAHGVTPESTRVERETPAPEEPPEPAPRRDDWAGGSEPPGSDVVAEWAREMDEEGTKSRDIAARYGVSSVRIGMLISHWRRRQVEQDEFFEDEVGGMR